MRNRKRRQKLMGALIETSIHNLENPAPKINPKTKAREVKRAAVKARREGGAGISTSKLDPSRTLTLRRAQANEVSARFDRLKGRILKFVGVEDAFGLDEVRVINSKDQPRDDHGRFGSTESHSSKDAVISKFVPEDQQLKRRYDTYREYEKFVKDYRARESVAARSIVDEWSGWSAPGEGFHAINQMLRDVGPDAVPDAGSSGKTESIAGKMYDLIQRAPETEIDLTMYRFQDWDLKHTVGDEFTLSGFTGASVTQPVTRTNAPIAMEILVPKGSKGVLLGTSKMEEEAILQHGARFKLVKAFPNTVGRYDQFARGNKKVYQVVYLGPKSAVQNISVAELDRAAAQAHPDPTPAQREAGNYKKGHITIQGIPITIETAAGVKRKPWHDKALSHHYGYIKRTESEADGDHVDVFLGPHLNSDKVFVVDQLVHGKTKATEGGQFDEHKCMVGFRTAEEAKAAYRANYADDWQGFGGITEMSVEQFKRWVKEGDTSGPLSWSTSPKNLAILNRFDGRQQLTFHRDPEGDYVRCEVTGNQWVTNASFFATCERDAKGHCESGAGGETGDPGLPKHADYVQDPQPEEKAKGILSRWGAKVNSLVDRVPVVGKVKQGVSAAMGAVQAKLAARYGDKAAAVIMASGSVGGYGVMTLSIKTLGFTLPFVTDIISIAGHVAVAEGLHQLGYLKSKPKMETGTEPKVIKNVLTWNDEELTPEDIERLAREAWQEIAERFRDAVRRHKDELEEGLGEEDPEDWKATENQMLFIMDEAKGVSNNLWDAAQVWIERMIRLHAPTENSNPEGHNQYTGGMNKKKGEDAKVGDSVTILGKTNKVTDFGQWTDIKQKYPEAAKRALESLPPHVPESKLGRTWVIQDEHGEHWLVGKAGMNMFVTVNILFPFSQKTLTGNAFEFRSDLDKIKAFQEWLREQFDEVGLTDEQLWAKYAQAGFVKGAGRAHDETKGSAATVGPDKLEFYTGGREGFLQTSLGKQVAVDKVKMLAGRAFDDLKNINHDMSTKMSRALTDGLVQGKNPREVARELVKEVDLGKTRALVIARTELVRAHAAGQLHAFRDLGVGELGVDVEFSASGKGNMCEECAELDGTTFGIDEAEGVIPVHPQCCCSWTPAVPRLGKMMKNRKMISNSNTEQPRDEHGRFAGTGWHGTNEKAAEKIRKEGFDLKEGKTAYYGAGAYFFVDPDKGAKQATGYGTKVFKSEIHLQHPYMQEQHMGFEDKGHMPYLTAPESPFRVEIEKRRETDPTKSRAEHLTDMLKERGYDGVISWEDGKRIAVVFDPKKLHVTNSLPFSQETLLDNSNPEGHNQYTGKGAGVESHSSDPKVGTPEHLKLMMGRLSAFSPEEIQGALKKDYPNLSVAAVKFFQGDPTKPAVAPNAKLTPSIEVGPSVTKSQVHDAAKKLAAKSGSHGDVKLHELHDALGRPKMEEFHRHVKDLWQESKVAPYQHEGRHGITEREQETALEVPSLSPTGRRVERMTGLTVNDKGSFFTTCERDAKGHCEAGGEGNREVVGRSEGEKEKGANKSKYIGAKVGKEEHVYSAKVEQEVAQAVGGTWEEDNKPYDVRIPNQHAFEVKSLLKGTKQVISVHDDALLRKVEYTAENPAETYHTIAVDERATYGGGEFAENYSGHRLYYKRGSGRYALSQMHRCKDEAELKKLVVTPDKDLPEKARGSLPKTKVEIKKLRESAEKAHASRLAKDRARKAKIKTERESKVRNTVEGQKRDEYGRWTTSLDERPKGWKAPQGTVTRVDKGVVLLESLLKLPGLRNEHELFKDNKGGRYVGKEWEDFKKAYKKGKIPPKVIVEVNHEGKVGIMEGNHRLRAALETGAKDINVEVRYYGNSQKKGLLKGISPSS